VPEGFNPTRLTLARKRRGFTKGELARLIGVDLRSITAYEAGEYPPSEDTLARISSASALEFPTDFFYGDDLEEPKADAASFRAMSRMTASQRDMALGEGALALHLNNWLERRFELPKVDLPHLGRERSPEAAAETLRRRWGIGELPINNMVHLLEAKGVRIFSLDVDTREVDAFSMWREVTPFVFLNSYKSSEHSRFDAAHELGHLVLHRHGGPHGRAAEKEADAFASAFLMPRASVLAHAPRFVTWNGLIKLKKIWSTSVAALNYRLHALGLTTDWQYRGMCIEISSRGRDKEPDECQHETSQILNKVLASLHDDGITRGHIAKELGLAVAELNRMIFGLVMTGIEGGRRTTSAPSSAQLVLVKK